MPLDGQIKNFAPLSSLEEARKPSAAKEAPDGFLAFLKEVNGELSSNQSPIWHQIIEQGRLMALLRTGKRIPKRRADGAGWVALRPIPSANLQDRSNYPILPSIHEDWKSKWLRSRSFVQPQLLGNGYRAEIQSKEISTVIRHYFTNIHTTEFEIAEFLSAADYGTYIHRYFYDDVLNQITKYAPVYQDKDVQMPGYGSCLNCAFDSEDINVFQQNQNMPQCPECGSFNLSTLAQPQTVTQSEMSDLEKITQGDINGMILPFPACRYDARYMPHDSSYFDYRTEYPTRRIRHLLGDDIELAEGESADYGLQVIKQLAGRGGVTETTGLNDTYGALASVGHTTEILERWLKPDWYADVKLPKDEKTASGVIPKGVPLGDIFPDGIRIVAANNGDLVLGVFGEKRPIVGGNFIVQAFSGIGSGLENTIDIAKDLNELHTMNMAQLKRHGAGGVVVEKSLGLTEENVRNLFKPQGVVPVDLQKSGLTDIRQAVMKMQMPATNPEVTNYIVQLNNLLQAVALSGDYSEGTLQTVDINTLGGQQLATAKEESKKGAIFMGKSRTRELAAEVIFNLFKKHIKIPRSYVDDWDTQARTKRRLLSGEDFQDCDVRFFTVPDSETPKNQFEKQMAAREMIDKAGGIGNFATLVAQAPEVAEWYANMFNVTAPGIDRDEIVLVCHSRLEDIEQLSQVFDDPEQILASLQKPLYVEESAHLLKSTMLQELLDDDEAAEWNPIARETVRLLINRHRDLQAEFTLQDERRSQNVALALQGEAQQAQMAQQMPMMQQQHQMQMEQNAQQAEQAAMEQVGQKLLEDEQSQVAFDREMQGKEADHARNLEMEQMKAKAAKGAKSGGKK